MHNHESAFPAWPKPAEENPEEPVRGFEPRLRMPSLQGSKLLAQGQVFEQQFATWENDTDEQSEEQSQQSEHAVVVAGNCVCKIGSKHSSGLVSLILNVSEYFYPKSQISMLGYNFGEGHVTLPASQLFVTTLDNQHTRVYARTTGLLVPVDQNLETETRAEAQGQLQQAALADGILDVARKNAQATVTTLMYSLGFEHVDVK
jgi:hypothetical protein